ncbi:MAG: hypothetical protein H6509_02800 [Bryobacterales bacterium]|nr:hypothetical protein [Bryobacterales bacterium]
MIVAIGAHSRKAGKTSIVCALLRATPEVAWTAVKISSNRRGRPGGLAVHEEDRAGLDRDTGRFLAAGAARAVWMRARDEEMAAAAAELRRIAAEGEAVLVESNRIVEHLDPDLYALALDFCIADFKDSARRLFPRADAYVVAGDGPRPAAWPLLPYGLLRHKPVHRVRPPDYAPAGLIDELRRRLGLLEERAVA